MCFDRFAFGCSGEESNVFREIEDDLFTQGPLSLPPMPFCIFLFRLFGVLSGDPVKLERRKEKEQI